MDRKNIFSFLFIKFQKTPKICNSRLEHRLNICDRLLKRNEIKPFLKRIITGNKKWVKYENIV